MMSGDRLRVGPDGVTRCWWCGDDPLYVHYHDEEWGHPVTSDVRLFEKLCLEGFQAGLAWITILRKREHFRAAFAGFELQAVAAFDEGDVARLLADAGIVRHRGKIESTINNAGRALVLRDEFGSIFDYVSRFRPARSAADGERRPVRHLPRVGGDVEGPQEAGLELRRAHHDVRLHAGDGPRQRPHRGLRARGLRPGEWRTGSRPVRQGFSQHIAATSMASIPVLMVGSCTGAY